MAKKKQQNVSTDIGPEGSAESPVITTSDEASASRSFEWFQFIQDSDVEAVRKRFSERVESLLKKHSEKLSGYVCLGLVDSDGSISSFESDRVYRALIDDNPNRSKDILLVILSNGGSVEPAFHISKLCKRYAKERFVVVIPRQAKSAATLIAIGADEIHMGHLGELGPIDPQIGGLPALGVSQALSVLASQAQKYPGSAEMFARYLQLALTVEQIGYCERIGESAVQYAERLLSTKSELAQKAEGIARELVYEYKDHSFVIDIDEAREHLGEEWITSDTPEIAFAEEFYRLYEETDLFLRILKEKRLLVVGNLRSGAMIFDTKDR